MTSDEGGRDLVQRRNAPRGHAHYHCSNCGNHYFARNGGCPWCKSNRLASIAAAVEEMNLDELILLTPTGDVRDRLTELNMIRLAAAREGG